MRGACVLYGQGLSDGLAPWRYFTRTERGEYNNGMWKAAPNPRKLQSWLRTEGGDWQSQVARGQGSGEVHHALGSFQQLDFNCMKKVCSQGCQLRGARGAARPPWPRDCIGFRPTCH